MCQQRAGEEYGNAKSLISDNELEMFKKATKKLTARPPIT